MFKSIVRFILAVITLPFFVLAFVICWPLVYLTEWLSCEPRYDIARSCMKEIIEPHIKALLFLTCK